jgi:steroid 5-alpha reductase family enzyme
MSSYTLYLTSLLITLFYTSCIFFIAKHKKDNSIIDIAYGPGFIITAVALACIQLTYHPLPTFGSIIFILILIWGIRLSRRIYKKNKHKGEDFRYRAWREDWMIRGEKYFLLRSYVQIFILQGIIISLVLLPFTLSISSDLQNTIGYTIPLLLGVLLWALGFIFESVGDAQLDRFISKRYEHKSTLIKSGLWKYTRHPNYFGESLMWVGIAVIAFGATMSLFVFVSPFLITGLLLFVSGVPMLEKKWEDDKNTKEEWEHYKKKTSMFFPLPPRR